ncbi:XisH protein [Candidatus Magnetomorum sp. HK-1]|nr:XisH protein [Candidatus Magnetomorum sp. HK-1]
MPAKDIYHENMKKALIKDGWKITHEQMHLKWGMKDLYVDLGAEKLMVAEKDGRKIGVKVKSFVGHSEMNDLEKAIGQYIVYHDILKETEPERDLYIAVPEEIFVDLFEEPIGKLLIGNKRFRLIVFDPLKEEIRKWID